MLAKLIKLDLRFAYKKFFTMAAILLVTGLVLPWLSMNVLKFGLPLVITPIFFVIPVLCVWLVVQHFQRNLFGNEGYLMFTLPVSTNQLLLSKLITTILWFNLMLGAAFGLVLLLLRDQMSVLKILAELLDWVVIKEAVRVVLLINANVLPIILAVFLGLALATVAVRNKKLGNLAGQIISAGGIAAFVWSCIKLGGWTYLEITTIKPFFEVSTSASMWINGAIAACFGALFFLVTSAIMRRKLNLS